MSIFFETPGYLCLVAGVIGTVVAVSVFIALAG
jgi:hypothetical protein